MSCWCLLTSPSPVQSWNNLDLWWFWEICMRAEPVDSPRKGRNPSCFFIKFRSWFFSRVHGFLKWVHILSCWWEEWENLHSINTLGPPKERINKIIPYFSLTLSCLSRIFLFWHQAGNFMTSNTVFTSKWSHLKEYSPVPPPPLALQLANYQIKLSLWTSSPSPEIESKDYLKW